ncbi:hypothetical protein QTP86_009916 [Hemibagrus guttatus]|nr:hypothetical protein QTP86_009916 [Hemibagrus guttatus]
MWTLRRQERTRWILFTQTSPVHTMWNPTPTSATRTTFLNPAYRPFLKQVKTWPAGATSSLQDCFECTDWNMFLEAATNGDSVNLEDYTTSATSYIGKCMDDMTFFKNINIRSDQKPWKTAKVRVLLKSRDSTSKAVDKIALRTATVPSYQRGKACTCPEKPQLPL